MIDRRKSSELQNAFAAALLVVTGIIAAPALAATSYPLPCKDASEVTLHVHIDALSTELLSHDLARDSVEKSTRLNQVSVTSASGLLAPRAEAAIREAFEDSEELILTAPMTGAKIEVEAAVEEDNLDDTAIEMTTKLPGISDDDLSRFRKQMYRRDI